MKKIYIAGFNVSLSEVQPLVAKYKALCAKYGCKALFPTTSNQVKGKKGKKFDTPLEEAQAVFQADLHKIDAADAIIANLDYYGNFYANSDTIFEIGYAYAKGKRIIGHVNHEYQTGYYAFRGYVPGQFADEFGRPTNLMVACATSVVIQGDFEDCLELVFNESYHDGDCKIYTIAHRA